MKTPTASRTGIAGLLATALLISVVSAQNVGIGTNTPQSKLSVDGSTASGGIAVGDASYTSTPGTVAPLNGAIIQGNTGIGTSAPSHLLHIADGNFARVNSDGNTSTFITTDGGILTYRNGPALGAPTVNGYVDVRNNPGTGVNYGRMFYYKGVAGQPTPNDAGEGLAFGVGLNTHPRVLIEANTGNVGIGTPTPDVKLHVVGGDQYVTPVSGFTGNIGTGTASTTGVWLQRAGVLSAHNSTSGLSVLNLSKSTSAAGDSYARFLSGGVGIGSITRTAGGVAFNTTSDLRLKENIRPSALGLKEVMKMQVSDYNYKAKPGHDEVGFIAQQLHSLVPSAVTIGGEDPKEDPWTVDYGRVTPVLVNAIQEQQAEITSLKTKLATLDDENRQLRAQVETVAMLVAKLEALEKAVALTSSSSATASITR